MSNIQDSFKESIPSKAHYSASITTERLRRHNHREKVTRSIPAAMNATGFSIIPVELLSEILSYIPRPVDPLSTERWSLLFSDADAEDYLAWRKTVLSLSQTCRHWREFFWPQLWRRIDICEGMYNEEHEMFRKAAHAWDDDVVNEKLFNVELVRQLEVVTVRDPYLAEYVNVINIELVEFSIKPVLVELARCLSLFPNLQAVKVQLLQTKKTKSNLTSLVRSVFSKHKYPQIRSVGICDMSYPFLSSCPEARSVNWKLTSSDRFDDHISSQGPLPIWPWVECLELAVPYLRRLEDIAMAFPNIGEFTLKWMTWYSGVLPSLDFMPMLQQLQKMEIFVFQDLDKDARMMFVNLVVGRLLELQKTDGTEKEAVWHWTDGKFAIRPTVRETKILPAPRRR